METTMINRRAFVAATLATGSLSARAQAFPTHTISFVVPVPPAGILDTVARMVIPPMSASLGQTIVVDNRTGAGGNIAAGFVARAPADGHTLLVGYSMFHVGNPSMYRHLSWDPIKDFAPVAMLVVSPHVMAIHPSVPAKNMKEFVEYVRANPGKVNYASPGSGSVPHVGVELFKQQNHLDMVHVPYRGAGPAIQDLIAGTVQMTVATPPSIASFVQTGKVRALCVAAKKRIARLPEVPTSAEAGFPGFELEAWIALFAPIATPAAAIQKLSESARLALQTPEVIKAAENNGVEIRYMNPAQLDATVRTDIAYWSKVIKAANITVE
jgi:tripartite-type tricarboxylate transporter receptor subunit TctC